MTYARKTLVSLADTPYYHVVARCVRRVWLWGFDEYAGHVERWKSGEAVESELQVAEAIIEGWRHRLCDISWFMH